MKANHGSLDRGFKEKMVLGSGSLTSSTKCPSHLSDPAMRKLLQEEAIQNFYLPIQAPLKIVDGIDAFRDVVAKTIGDRTINYLEFGVASGNSMRSTLNLFGQADSRFFGFDSFDGLPEEWVPLREAELGVGAFSTHGALPNIDDRRLEFIRGWFQDTLPSFLSSGVIGGTALHLIHYDADLYSSTSFILGCLWHHLPDYYFIMDEFPYDEVVALRNFVHAYPVNVEFIAQTNPSADFPDKVFGRMRRTPFSL